MPARCTMQALHVTARTSKASPPLLLACASGQHLKSAVLTGRKAGKAQLEFLTFSLSDVLVAAYQIGGDRRRRADGLGLAELRARSRSSTRSRRPTGRSARSPRPAGTSRPTRSSDRRSTTRSRTRATRSRRRIPTGSPRWPRCSGCPPPMPRAAACSSSAAATPATSSPLAVALPGARVRRHRRLRDGDRRGRALAATLELQPDARDGGDRGLRAAPGVRLRDRARRLLVDRAARSATRCWRRRPRPGARRRRLRQLQRAARRPPAPGAARHAALPHGGARRPARARRAGPRAAALPAARAGRSEHGAAPAGRAAARTRERLEPAARRARAASTTPWTSTEFAAHAAAHGLQYLAEADFFEMQTTADGAGAADRRPVVRREQYMDFLKGRMFRQTLLCHAGRAGRPDAAARSRGARSRSRPGPRSRDGRIVFTGPTGSTLTTDHPDVDRRARSARPRTGPRPCWVRDLRRRSRRVCARAAARLRRQPRAAARPPAAVRGARRASARGSRPLARRQAERGRRSSPTSATAGPRRGRARPAPDHAARRHPRPRRARGRVARRRARRQPAEPRAASAYPAGMTVDVARRAGLGELVRRSAARTPEQHRGLLRRPHAGPTRSCSRRPRAPRARSPAGPARGSRRGARAATATPT